MFKFVVLCAFLATSFALHHGHGHSNARSFSHSRAVGKSVVASSDDAHAEVISAASDVRPDGFDYHLETSNAISAKASGDANGNINGNFQWISPEGEHVALSYVADENGYQPDSALLPTPPPIPEAILRAIRYIETHPPKPEAHHGRKY